MVGKSDEAKSCAKEKGIDVDNMSSDLQTAAAAASSPDPRTPDMEAVPGR